MKVTASHDPKNYLVVRDDLTRRDRNRYIAALTGGDKDLLETVLRETVQDVQLVIDGEPVKGLAAVIERGSDENMTAQVEGFWLRAWGDAYAALQGLGKPKAAS